MIKFKNIIKNIISNPNIFFLKNLGIKQIILKNTFWLGLSGGISRLLKLFLIIYVARILGATEYGKFTFALAFVSLFAVLEDMGIPSVITREFAKDKKREKDFPAIFSLMLVLIIVTLLLIFISSFFITSDPVVQKIIWILGISVTVSGFTRIIFAFFQARQKMEYQSWVQIFQALIVTAVGFFVLFNLPSVKNLSLSYLFASILALFFVIFLFYIKIQPIKFNFNKTLWRNYLTMSWPLALVGIFGIIYNQIDSIMMGYWGQITEVGWYNAAYKIMGVSLIPSSLIATSFFPFLSKRLAESKKEFKKAWSHFLGIMIFLAMPIVTGGIVLAPKIINFVYGPSYYPSIFAFQILILGAGMIFLLIPFSQALIVSNQQRKLFLITFFAAAVNVFLNFILIPNYSLYGAAVATAVTYFLALLLYIIVVLRTTTIKSFNFNVFASFFSSLFAAAIMYFTIARPEIYSFNIFISALIGSVVYLLSFSLIRKVINAFQ
ncbi:MAG: flippase [Patescibacteria group bacterium]|nr:flippase [Patescibacteria group bacterium]